MSRHGILGAGSRHPAGPELAARCWDGCCVCTKGRRRVRRSSWPSSRPSTHRTRGGQGSAPRREPGCWSQPTCGSRLEPTPATPCGGSTRWPGCGLATLSDARPVSRGTKPKARLVHRPARRRDAGHFECCQLRAGRPQTDCSRSACLPSRAGATGPPSEPWSPASGSASRLLPVPQGQRHLQLVPEKVFP